MKKFFVLLLLVLVNVSFILGRDVSRSILNDPIDSISRNPNICQWSLSMTKFVDDVHCGSLVSGIKLMPILTYCCSDQETRIFVKITEQDLRKLIQGKKVQKNG